MRLRRSAAAVDRAPLAAASCRRDRSADARPAATQAPAAMPSSTTSIPTPSRRRCASPTWRSTWRSTSTQAARRHRDAYAAMGGSARDQLVLDTRDLTIAKVEGADGAGQWMPLEFALADARPDPRQQAHDPGARSAMPQVRITYTTSPDASGLQWLTPAMTAGQEAALHVQPVAGDPRAQLGAAAGHAGRALHLHARTSPRRRTRWC